MKFLRNAVCVIEILINFLLEKVAEREGFEPSVQLPVRQFSKLVVSATHPSLLLTIYFLSKAMQIYYLYYDIFKFFEYFF